MSTFKTEQLARHAQAVNANTNLMGSVFFHFTDNAAAAVATAGYFNDARAKLQVGDLILASVGIGGTAATLLLRVTAVPSSGNVTVAGGTVTTS